MEAVLEPMGSKYIKTFTNQSASSQLQVTLRFFGKKTEKTRQKACHGLAEKIIHVVYLYVMLRCGGEINRTEWFVSNMPQNTIAHRIHGTGIFTYMNTIKINPM